MKESVVLCILFVAAGTGHFVRPDVFERIVPPGVPAREAVLLSGAAEIVGGLGLLSPTTRRAAGAGLIALLLAVWPANLWMALNANAFEGIPPWLVWARVPLQLPLIWWVWRVTRPNARSV
ncbi:DoxX family protein [Deinococcus yavapaiensis]|uniref:Putative membrane protein n=1 Tax=Deinococcus yavapaiensis KR-236 TaxID=694435 RepID=A0A318S9U2_9DEIO|nr:hypothetical protein [Deinococcus yavapaiensis]PYE54820.1 putative membrane protein [Deinococcus yavapaiensis KR-236]